MPSSAKSILYKAAKETLVEYFEKTSLNGFGLLYYIRRRKYQRLFWFMFIALGISFASYVVSFTLLDFLRDPTVTQLESLSHPIQEVPYPAVSVCSSNKLSRLAVQQLTLKILASQTENLSKDHEYWLKRFKLLAGYFFNDAVDLEEAKAFQVELENLLGAAANPLDLITRLAPQCQDLLLKCYWLGESRQRQQMFKLFATPEGFCCIYNFQDSTSAIVYPKEAGIESGLTLLLNASVADYFVSRNFHGFVIQIFEASDAPDPSSGGVEEIFISPGQDVSVQLSVLSQLASPEAREYSVEKRSCYFPNEFVPNYGFVQSDAKCLAKCKLRSMLELCGCMVFYGDSNDTSYCTLRNLECIERYQVTWNTYRPASQKLPESLLKDLPRSVQCFECLPSCSYNRFYSRQDKGKLSETRLLPETRKYLANMSVNLDRDVSLVKLYFPTPYATQYRKNLLFNWYQILSNIGGVIGISMGCSFISGFEIIYFLGVRVWQRYLIFRQGN